MYDTTTCFGLVNGPSSGCSQNLRGDYTLGVVNIWGGEISSYIIVQGVNAGYQRFTHVCTCHLKSMHNHYLTLACRWPSVFTIQGNIKFIHQIHGLKQVTYKHNISLSVVLKYAKITNEFHYICSVQFALLVALICILAVNLHIKVLYLVLLTYT